MGSFVTVVIVSHWLAHGPGRSRTEPNMPCKADGLGWAGLWVPIDQAEFGRDISPWR